MVAAYPFSTRRAYAEAIGWTAGAAFPFAPSPVDPQTIVIGVDAAKYGFQIPVDIDDIFRCSKPFSPGPYLWTGIG